MHANRTNVATKGTIGVNVHNLAIETVLNDNNILVCSIEDAASSANHCSNVAVGLVP